MRESIIYISFLISFFCQSLFSQDPQLSQFYSSPLYMGPFLQVLHKEGGIIINYRDQWPKISGTFVTYALSGDYYFDKYKSGVGLLMLKDDAGNGLMNITNLGLNYSYNFSISRNWQVRPGIQAYYYMKEINYDLLRFGDQILRGSGSGTSVELNNLLSSEPIRHFDFTSSVLAYSESLWFGFTVDHLMYLVMSLPVTGPMFLCAYRCTGEGNIT